MGYNSKLEQTNRKVARAKRKYYGSFDYGSGTRVFSKGGKFSFAKTFEGGGPRYGDAIATGVGIVGNALADSQTDLSYVDWARMQRAKEQALAGSLFGADDNSGLLAALDDAYLIGPELRTFDSSNGRQNFAKIATAAGTGAVAGSMINTGIGTLVGAAAGALAEGAGILGKRLTAKANVRKGNALTEDLNIALSTAKAKAIDATDTRNDLMRQKLAMDTVNYGAFGGPITHGVDFNNGLTFINAGGSHEANPNEGVPIGLDDEGIPNLVEQGEVIWNNDYVFSDRTKITKELAKKYGLGGDLSFADAIKEVTKESEMRPNDPISNATNKAIVEEFMEVQEGLRQKEQVQAAKEYNDALDAQFMEQLATMPQAAPEEQGMNVQVPQEYQQEPYPMQDESMMPPGYAKGGHLFKDGGEKLRIFKEYKEAFKKERGLSIDPAEDDVYRGEFFKYIREKDPNYYYRNFYGSLNDDYDASGSLKPLPQSYQDAQKSANMFSDSIDITDVLEPSVVTAVRKRSPMDVKIPESTVAPFEGGTVEFPEMGNPIDEDFMNQDAASNLEELLKSLPKAESPKPSETASSKEKTKTIESSDMSLRDIPILASGLAAGYGLMSSPDYSNVEPLFPAAQALGTPVSIPVETIGDYVQTRPFDERYLVNQAVQARNAAYRGSMDTSGGNRAMQLGAQSYLAGAYQNNLAEIMRQAYLANRQDAMTAAEFNRGTNLQNMSAINARNTAQTQLNSQRQQAGYSALASAYGMKQGIKDAWDNTTQTSLNTFIQNIADKAREDSELNRFMSLIKEGYVLDYDPKSDKYFFSGKNEKEENKKKGASVTSNAPIYAPLAPAASKRASEEIWVAHGGKLRKKRRF